MSLKDPISDLFTRIRNALIAKHEGLMVPNSKIKVAICRILKEEGFIKDFTVSNDDLVKKNIKIKLKYRQNGEPLINEIIRVSKSSKRIYVKKRKVPKPLRGFGISMVSTSKGILSGREARLKNVGGELVGIVT